MSKRKLILFIVIGIIGIVSVVAIFSFIPTVPESHLDNPNFESDASWESFKEGDESDIETSISEGHANYEILGEQKQFEIMEAPPVNETWTAVNNQAFPTEPNTYNINSDGCYVSHYWNEDEKQAPSIHFLYRRIRCRKKSPTSCPGQ